MFVRESAFLSLPFTLSLGIDSPETLEIVELVKEAVLERPSCGLAAVASLSSS